MVELFDVRDKMVEKKGDGMRCEGEMVILVRKVLYVWVFVMVWDRWSIIYRVG